jgi:hypothetical protein
MIQPSEVSVVIQGPVVGIRSKDERASATTYEVLESVRANLPGSEVILSTWRGQNLEGLAYDKLVLSEDPGASYDRELSSSANILRQVRSSHAGLLQATRRYALKLRSDTTLTSSEFLHCWDTFRSRGMKPALFAERVLVSAIFTPNPFHCPSPYWVSDFFAFGWIEDVRRLWDVPVGIIQRLFKDNESQNAEASNGALSRSALNAEQRLMISMMERHGILESVKTITTVNPLLLMRSEKFIASHFIPVDPQASGFNLPNRFHKFRTHHTYRCDHLGSLFRSANPISARIAWVNRIPVILFACAKGLAGRLRRSILAFGRSHA